MIAPLGEQVDEQLKIIYLPRGFNSWQLDESSFGQSLFMRQKCPVDRCFLTESANEATLADAILMKDFENMPEHQRPTKQIWIMYTLESPLSMSFHQVGDDAVNWTATYRQDSELAAPYEKWIKFDNFKEKVL